MFSPTTTKRPIQRVTREPASPLPRVSSRSLRDLVRNAVGTAIEFATLGEATLPRAPERPAPPAHSGEHPHRRRLERRPRSRRDGTVPGRPQVCTTPIPPAGRHH